MTRKFLLLPSVLVCFFSVSLHGQGVYQMISSLDEIDVNATYIIYGYNLSAVSTKALRGETDGGYLLATDFAKSQVDEAAWTITIPASSPASDIPAELQLVPVDEGAYIYGVQLKKSGLFVYNLSGDELKLTDMAPEENRAIQWQLVESPRVNGVVLNNVRNSSSYIFNTSNKFKCSDKALNGSNNRGVLCKKIEDHVVIGSGGYASYVTVHDIDFARSRGVTAYEVTEATASGARLARVDMVPAGTPLILKGSAGDHVLVMADGMPSAPAGNLLQHGGTTGDGRTVFALGSRNGSIGFFRVQNGVSVGEDKPFLVISGTAENVVFVPFIFGEDLATGLSPVVSSPSSSSWYSLDGRPLLSPGPGVFLHGGRKVVVR